MAAHGGFVSLLVVLTLGSILTVNGSDICSSLSRQAENGVINSPNWPRNYQEDTICATTITIPGNTSKVIELYFIEFGTENHPNCGYDYLRVHDGADDKAKLLGAFCGDSLPPTVVSSTNQLHLVFRADGSHQDIGFQTVFTAVRSLAERQNKSQQVQYKCPTQSRQVTLPDGAMTVEVELTDGFSLSLPSGQHTVSVPSTNCTVDITVTLSLARQCPPSYIYTDPSTDLAPFDYTEYGVSHSLSLPAGSYLYSYENLGITLPPACPSTLKVIDSRVRRRLVFEAKYNIECSSDQKSLEAVAQYKYTDIEEICAGKCNRTAGVNITLTCASNVITIVWPTDTVYKGNVTDIKSDPIYNHLLPGLKRKSALDMFIFDGAIPKIVYPIRGTNDTAADVSLTSFCDSKFTYSKATDTCVA